MRSKSGREREARDGYVEKEVEQVGGTMGVNRDSFERMRVRDKVKFNTLIHLGDAGLLSA